MTMTTAEFGRMMKVLDEENITRRWADTYEYFSITAEFTDVLYRHCRVRKRDSNSNNNSNGCKGRETTTLITLAGMRDAVAEYCGRSDIGRRRVIMNGIYTVMNSLYPDMMEGVRKEVAMRMEALESGSGMRYGEEAYRDIIRDCR